jgi:hypothetical protein
VNTSYPNIIATGKLQVGIAIEVKEERYLS